MIAMIAMISLTILSFSGKAQAGDTSTGGIYEIDASLSLASRPKAGYNDATSGNFGAGIMLNQSKSLQGRIDFSSFQWRQSYFDRDNLYNRKIVVIGSRYYMMTHSDLIKFFIQAGVEVSSDKQEVKNTLTGITTSTSRTTTGITPGLGFELCFGPNIGMIISGRYHVISDSYYDLMAGLAVHF